MERKDELIINEHLRSIGEKRESIPQKKWEQLCIVYEAIKTLETKHKELTILLRENNLTITNIERIINDSPNHHISHALFYQKNRNGLLNRFIASFMETANPNETTENRYKKQITLLEETVKKLAKHDYQMLLLEQDVNTLKRELIKHKISIPRLNELDDIGKRNESFEEESKFATVPSSKSKNNYS